MTLRSPWRSAVCCGTWHCQVRCARVRAGQPRCSCVLPIDWRVQLSGAAAAVRTELRVIAPPVLLSVISAHARAVEVAAEAAAGLWNLGTGAKRPHAACSCVHGSGSHFTCVWLERTVPATVMSARHAYMSKALVSLLYLSSANAGSARMALGAMTTHQARGTTSFAVAVPVVGGMRWPVTRLVLLLRLQ